MLRLTTVCRRSTSPISMNLEMEACRKNSTSFVNSETKTLQNNQVLDTAFRNGRQHIPIVSPR